MQNFSTQFYISTIKSDEFKHIKTGKLRTSQNFIYAFKDKKVETYQANPFKILKTQHLKEKIRDMCFSTCNRFFFIFANNEVRIYKDNTLIGSIKIDFDILKMECVEDYFLIIDNVKILRYKISKNKEYNKNDNTMCYLNKNSECRKKESNGNTDDETEHFFDVVDPLFSRKTIFDIDFKNEENYGISFFDKIEGNAIYINRKIVLIGQGNTLKIQIDNINKIAINFPAEIVKILADSLMSKVYVLGKDGKVYISYFNNENNVFTKENMIQQESIKDIVFSFCESNIYLRSDKEIFCYATKNNNLIERWGFGEEVEDFIGLLKVDYSSDIKPFNFSL